MSNWHLLALARDAGFQAELMRSQTLQAEDCHEAGQHNSGQAALEQL